MSNFSRQNLIKIYTKTHQTAPYFQNFLGGASIMLLNPLACVCNYNQYVFLHGNSHLLFKIISKYTPKRIDHKMFKKISSLELPYSKRVSKIYVIYIKMVS